MPSPSDNIDLGFLSDTERDLILEVLRRDEDLRQAEEQRIRKLKTELLEIKRKGAKRGSGRYSQRSCGRCQGSLSLLAFGSSQCLRCHHLVCSNCRASLPDGSWLCIVCIKESDLRKSTGDWFYNLRVNRFSATPGHELVRSSLRQRPELKKYVTMGDVLLKNSESTQGPPVPVPRQKVNANSRRPSGENAGSVSSMTSFEAKGDAFVYHGPPSEYSGSVASTASFETKGIDGLLKPSQSDTESAEIASLASSKTDTESGRATPDLPRRAILPPLNSHSNVTLLPDAVSIHSYSLEANTGPEIQQAVPSSEFDVDKLFKKSIKRVEDSPDSVNYGVNEQAEVPVDGGGQFVQGLDTQVPEIKQGIPIPEFDVDEYLKKRVKDIENPTEYMNYGLDFCDQSHTYESLADITSHLVQDSDTQVPDRMQDIPRSEFDRDKLFKKSVKHTENSTECVRYEWDLCDQSHIYESLVDIKSQYVQDSDMQVPDINQDIPISEFDVDELFKKSVTHIEDPPERVNYGRDVCVRSHTYESLVDTESQFVQDLDTQVPEIKEACTSPELELQKLFKKSISRTEHPPDSHGKRDKLTLPMGNRSQSVPDLDMQDDEEEDIDSLVNFHKSTMASSSSLRSTSMTSIYSDSGDSYSVDVRGEVVFTMFYDEPTQSLQVFIKECHKLAYGDTLRQFSNPYVKCYLLPDKSRQSKRKTTIKRHTCDPVYEETFKYSIRRNQLLTRSMLISVWHHGHLSSNPFLGEVEIALDCYDLDSLEEECMALMTKAPCCIPASAFTQFKGELAISLKFVTPKAPPLQKFKGKKVVEVQGGELHVLIKEAKNLMAMKGGVGGMSDSFVKGYLFPSKSKATKRKTAVMKKNLNPHYNHTFVYKELTLEQLQGMCLELTVWDKEPLLSNEFLGGVRLSSGKGSVKMGNDEVGMDSVGEEINLWQKMMQYPDSWAEGTLPLRTTMRKKKGK
ncbi:synaptotagmin-like protein 4 isoform X4 [Syngnathoides biaculeatus]|uniref:synaptotagmin-like protein 4 isoform X4 n=1 Tax=Syngnathoides biaculeatus TaxID=300417 RepID=UPI002ADE7E53|nr:synaptotagmin-like protein 4 isoform X4 [Syngnathoides biaculeatus]